MRHDPFVRTLAAWCALLACVLFPPLADAKLKWKDFDQTLLAETKGAVDPEAPSEAVFWEVRITDTFDGGGFRSEEVNYLRVKVFNDRGRELETKVELPYQKGESVDDIAGRTIRPNGTVVELKKDAIFERTVVKAGSYKGKAKSFAMPAVEPGAVIEYQWRKVRRDAPGLILYVQRSTPIRAMTMVITPFNEIGSPYTMQIRSFNITHEPAEREGASMTIRLKDIKGLETEPYMPPDDQVRPWFYLEYVEGQGQPTEKYWSDLGKKWHQEFKPFLEVTPAVRRTADSLVSSVADFDQRLRVIYDFCRTRIRSVNDDAYDYTNDFRSKLMEDEKRMPEETLRRGYGTSFDINFLFASLAQAAGFQTRMAVVSDRSENFFRRDNRLAFQLTQPLVAVQVSGQWKFYDPSDRDVSPGMLPWWEESQDALLLDREEPVFATTPLSLPSRSLTRRAGTLRLTADGHLEGYVQETYTGHLAAWGRESLDELSPERRLEEIRQQLRGRWPSASVDSIRISGVDDPLQPYGVAYRLSFPDYAERVGKRFLVQPELFERDDSPTFTASKRTHWLYFRHPWAEEDSLTIEIPPGYEVQADPTPDALNVGRTITHRMALQAEAGTIRLHRYFAFGMDGTILIHPSEYGRVKKGFDSIHQRDGYTLTLRPVEAAER